MLVVTQWFYFHSVCVTYLLRCGSLDWYWTGILRMLWLLCGDTTSAAVNPEASAQLLLSNTESRFHRILSTYTVRSLRPLQIPPQQKAVRGNFIVSVLNPYSVTAVSHQGNSMFLYSDWRTGKQLGSYSLPPLHS